MTGLGLFRRSDEEREAMAARRSAAKVADHERRRKRVLEYLASCPNGTAACLGAPLVVLRALLSRELVEVRFHLTPAGRREAEVAKRELGGE